MRYSTEQIEFLMSTLAAFWFCLLWLSVMLRLAKHMDGWVQNLSIVLPFLLLIAVLVYYWRKFRE